MKKTLTFIVLVCIFMTYTNAQTILTIENEKIDKEEFKRVYLKNNTGQIVTKSTVEEYLDLYINFKLKVRAAIEKDMHLDPAFKSELKGYRSQLAQPYLNEGGMMEELKKQAYERLKYEVKASHILVNCGVEASPEDTLKAYKRALELKKMAAKEGFAKVAQKHSDDPSAKQNAGNLGYFTAFYMVYPFESAAYQTNVGEVSNPIRTRFGYHLIKVEDKRPANGSMTAAHILISTDPEISSTTNARERANEIYTKLKEGDSFEDLAAQFSDDKRSSTRGGVLPPFSVGRMVKEFEEAAFKLKNDGDFTAPIKTQYGWHIIKRINKREIGEYDELQSEIEQKVKKDSRSNLNEGASIRKIMKAYGFDENLKERNDFYDLLDTSYFGYHWDTSTFASLNKTMFEIGSREVNQKEFAAYLNRRQVPNQAKNSTTFVNNQYKAFKKEKVLEYKDAQLENEYPEFKHLINEYHDGILLFNLTEKMVWKKAIEDTLGLETFYNNNKENYKWKDRVDAVIFSAANEDIAKDVKKQLKSGIEVSELREEINRTSQLNLKTEQKKYEKGENELVDQVEWKKGVSENIADQGRIKFVWIKSVIPSNYKTLEDSRGIITSDYQEYLEKEWIATLREKYNYKINTSVVEALKAELK